jgi:hypothetical protein
MDHNDSRFVLIFSACLIAFVLGMVGFAVFENEVKQRVDRRVDQRVCQLVPTVPCPAPAPVRSGGGD